MTLTVLVDNNTFIDQYYLGEPSLSFHIEEGQNRFLFDTGYSGIFLDNLKALGLDHRALERIVLSHGHNDHTGGLPFIPLNERRGTIYGHPQILEQKLDGNQSIGISLSKDDLEKYYQLVLSRNPVKITERITFLGEIPQIFEFEKRVDFGFREDRGVITPDFIMDDSALVYEGQEGLTIITGCSHSGICNIIERAKTVCSCSKVQGVIGGFHLFHENERVKKTIDYLTTLNLDIIYPCHCTSFEVKAAIHRVIPVGEVGVGLTLSWM